MTTYKTPRPKLFRPYFRKSLLSSIIFSSIFTCTETARAQGQVLITKGGEVTLSEALIETHEDNKIAVSVEDADSLAALTDTLVLTNGVNASGLSVANEGYIDFTGGSVTTLNATAVEVKSAGSIGLNNVDISSKGDGKTLISVSGSGSELTGNGLNLQATGANATGISVSDHAAVTMSDIKLELTNGSSGVSVSSADLSINNLTLKQNGADPQNVVYAMGDDSKTATVTLTNGHAEATGADGTLINANNNSHITLNGGVYASSGDNFTALFTSSTNSTLDANGIAVTTNGNTSHGVSNHGMMNLADSNISVSGDSSYALYSEGTLTASNMALSTAGSDTGAISAAGGGSVTLNKGTVETTGARGYGVLNHSGSHITATDIAVTTTGDGSHALLVNSGSDLSLSDSQVEAKGAGSAALSAMGAGGTNPQTTVNLKNSQLSSVQNQGLYASGSNLVVNLTEGAALSGGNGQLATVHSRMDGTEMWDSTVKLNADGGSKLTGDILTDGGASAVDVMLTNTSIWTGATAKGNNIELDSTSLWDMTASSSISTLNNQGTVNFRPQNNGFSTLTINNNLSGGGHFNINTQLGDDNSPTDKIDVKGNVSGDHLLTVNNIGGTGALTIADGIEVVNIDGTLQGSFSLTNRVAAGAYEYQLQQGGAQDSNNWYLRSSYLAPNPEPNPEPSPESDPMTDPDSAAESDPTPEPDPVIDPSPAPSPSNADADTSWRAEVPGYAAAPWLIQRYAFDALGTYHQRTGGNVNHKNGTWGRISTQHLNTDAGRFSYDTDTWFAQFGADLWENAAHERDHRAGWLVTIGNMKTDARDAVRAANPALSVNTGSIDTMAYSLGGYYTQENRDGSYVDIVSQATWYHTNYQSLVDATQHGFGIAASAEGGKPLAVYADWKIEPQLQMKLQYLNLDGFSDAISQVSGTSATHAQVRTGLRIYRENTLWTPYATLDAISDMGSSMTVSVASLPVDADFSSSQWQAGAGVSASLSDDSALYLDTRYIRAFDGTQEGYSGNIGVKVTF